MVRRISRADGFVHDIETIKVLSTEQCNIRVLSDRTLYILQNLSELDVTFESRYGVILANDLYEPVRLYTDDGLVQEQTVDIIRRDLTDMTIEDTLICLCDEAKAISGTLTGVVAAINSLKTAGCGCEVGEASDGESGTEGGAPPAPVGSITYSFPAEIDDRKCKAANSIHFFVRDLIEQLDDAGADNYGVLGLGIVISAVVGVIGSVATSPVGGLVLAVAGLVATFAAALVGIETDLSVIKDVLDENEDDLICALLSAVTADDARDAYESILVADATLGSVAIGMVMLLFTNSMVNVLFFETEDSEAFLDSYTPPNDCSACATTFSHTFLFDVTDGGWANGTSFGRPFGEWVDGKGWVSEWGSVAGDPDERLYLVRTFDTRAITSVSVFYTSAGGPQGENAGTNIQIIGGSVRTDDWPCTDCNFSQSEVFSAESTDEIRVVANSDMGSDGLEEHWAYRITITGIGTDPFV